MKKIFVLLAIMVSSTGCIDKSSSTGSTDELDTEINTDRKVCSFQGNGQGSWEHYNEYDSEEDSLLLEFSYSNPNQDPNFREESFLVSEVSSIDHRECEEFPLEGGLLLDTEKPFKLSLMLCRNNGYFELFHKASIDGGDPFHSNIHCLITAPSGLAPI
jgi:hypothetical protein